MKQFFTLALMAAGLMVTSLAQARMVASKPQCIASCGDAINTTCGWITKRGRFNRCRAHLITQCRKFGTEAMCPAPPPSPAPVTTTTTTTLPSVPPTTTTLPPPVYGPWTGTWHFYGTLATNTCSAGMPSVLSDTFYVVQVGTGFTAQEASLGSGVTYTGSMDSDGGFTIEATWTLDITPCVFTTVLSVSPIGGVIYTSNPAGDAQRADCPAYSCITGYSGWVSR
jgi:hypothetical protein